MDLTDFQILRAMEPFPWGRHPKDPENHRPTTIARKIGSTPETVKERLQRMEDSGVIRGYQAYPNPAHLGLSATVYVFENEDPDFKAKAREAVGSMDGLLHVWDLIGPLLGVEVAYRSPAELARRLKLLSLHTGDPEPRRIHDYEFPPVGQPPSPLDWRIIGALRGNARRPITEVADAIGAGYRTVKRRFDRLSADGSLILVPVLDLGRVPGLIPVDLFVYLEQGDDEATVRQILKTFDDRVALSILARDSNHLHVAVFAESLGEAEELRAQASAMPGVERVSALFFRSVSEHTAWLDDEIASRATNAST